MKSILFIFSVVARIQAHTLFQKVSVNGVDQGDLTGVRVPDSNFPISDVNDPNFACNSGISHKDGNLITIPQGAKVGTWWDHAIGGGQGPGDPDSPVAKSHKGPIQAYLAKVDDAVSSGTTGLQWFKVGSEGLNNGMWAVDNLVANVGWWSFTMPSCVTAGQYLMKVEIIALHGAYQNGGAQFYTECAQIQVTGSGTSNPATVSFPGAYSSTDPGILISIYDGNGQPSNNGQPYTIPGPPVLDCSNAIAPAPTTLVTSMLPSPTKKPQAYAPSPPPAANPVPATGPKSGAGYLEQCAGDGWTGPMGCSKGTCTFANQWFSQCL